MVDNCIETSTRNACKKYSVYDVFQFVDKIKNANTLGLKMTSLDVTSLFTNVQFIETVEYIGKQLIENEIETTVPINVVKELLFKCTMNVNFKFNGDDVAMGSPLSPILADIFLAKVENCPHFNVDT
ncbi:unnamed protein product [Schistosoma curassoni]|uniref:Reverse transcriptase domain-containing protein n=1 Tax=Schistosoma curassoni TaxID=6186 RepID=A0A183L096_9TREM|nr:unnamed protein product [Schistosoma curassoni]